MFAVNVVSQPVGLLRFPCRSNSIFQSAPRAVSILKRSPFLLKAKPFATSGWEPRAQGVVNGAGQTVLSAALRVVGVTNIVPGGKARMSRPTPPTPAVEIHFIRHRLDTKNFFAVNSRRGSAVGSGAGDFPNPSLTGNPIAGPQVSLLVKGKAVGARSTDGIRHANGRRTAGYSV